MNAKMIYLARRNPALDLPGFVQAWREHSALGRQCRNVQDKVRSVMQCARLADPGLAGLSADHDGVNLLQLRDLQAALDIWSDPETLAIMRPDEPRVFDRHVRDFSLVCREAVRRDGPPGEVCLVGFLRRSPSLSAAAFAQAWLQAGAASLPHGGRVVHNAVQLPAPPGYDYDGIGEWWFDGTASARAAFGRQDVRCALGPQLGGMADLQRSLFILTQVTHRRP
ncbi:EthD domain-containing protein [Caldimonas tepidiphila]|uniref:EthD domain-containing protein n=1 Tax=Caldimonas tepidiphila TaxID=2315841 RepID=UPI000E5C0EC9|nr:EthD domain-containing protein [Caldimonas tepidiphila]